MARLYTLRAWSRQRDLCGSKNSGNDGTFAYKSVTRREQSEDDEVIIIVVFFFGAPTAGPYGAHNTKSKVTLGPKRALPAQATTDDIAHCFIRVRIVDYAPVPSVIADDAVSWFLQALKLIRRCAKR